MRRKLFKEEAIKENKDKKTIDGEKLLVVIKLNLYRRRNGFNSVLV